MSFLRVFPFADPAKQVRFDRMTGDGFRILAAASDFARDFPTDIYLTSGTEGVHSGPQDPHPMGRAYDFETHLWGHDTKQAFVRAIVERAEGNGAAAAQVNLGWGTAHYWGWIEQEGQPTEHAHVQYRKGLTPR